MNKLTVFFENPYWVGVFERYEKDQIQVAKVVFGPEPKEPELYEFILKHYAKLRFSRPSKTDVKPIKKVNPKRLQRLAQKEQISQGIGTKAQRAIQAEREAMKKERKAMSKAEKEHMKEVKFQMKQEKRKQKKKGH